MDLEYQKPLVFRYKNWKGEVGVRTVHPVSVCYDSNEYHTTPQWLLVAEDLDKDYQIRFFAMNDILEFIKEDCDR